jgi:hypothetical protein
MFLVARRDDQLPVIPLSTVGIFPCIGAIDRDADAVAAYAFAAGGYESVRSLRRDRHDVDPSCWFFR